MNYATITQFRSNLAEYLETSKIERKPLVIGKRARQEFIVIPLNEENRKQLLETTLKNELEESRKGPFFSLDEIKKSLAL